MSASAIELVSFIEDFRRVLLDDPRTHEGRGVEIVNKHCEYMRGAAARGDADYFALLMENTHWYIAHQERWF